MRVVSLIPSGTEILASLGELPKLVGRSHGCDYPAEVKNRPILTKARCITEGTSLMIDKSVRDILKTVLSVYEIDVETLKDLKPDVILTQTKCEICAVSLKDVKFCLKEFLSSDITLVDLCANTLDDIYSDIQKVAFHLNVKEEGFKLIESIKENMNSLSNEVQHKTKPRVLCLGWIEPLMSSGNWIPELVEKAQAFEVLAKKGEDSYSFSFETLMKLDPEYLVVMPCGFSFSKTKEEMKHLIKNKGFENLQCVKKNQIFLTDGHFYFNRPSPRVLDSLDILIDIFHRGKKAKKDIFENWQSLK